MYRGKAWSPVKLENEKGVVSTDSRSNLLLARIANAMALSESLSGSSGRKSPLTLREDLSKIYDSFFLESTVMAE